MQCQENISNTHYSKQILDYINFKDGADEAIYDNQCSQYIEYFGWLEKYSIGNMCKVLQRYGDMRDDYTNDNEVKILDISEKNQQLMIDFIKHNARVSRSCKYCDVVITGMLKMKHQHKLEDSRQDSKKIPNIDFKDWSKTMEVISDYLQQLCGVNIDPLSYGSRKTLHPPVAAGNFDFGIKDNN